MSEIALKQNSLTTGEDEISVEGKAAHGEGGRSSRYPSTLHIRETRSSVSDAEDGESKGGAKVEVTGDKKGDGKMKLTKEKKINERNRRNGGNRVEKGLLARLWDMLPGNGAQDKDPEVKRWDPEGITVTRTFHLEVHYVPSAKQ